MNISNIPDLVTAADTNDTELVFTDTVAIERPQAYCFIEVVTGSFKFRVGSDATSSPADYTAGQKLVVTFMPGVRNIHFKASVAGQTFKISV